jgi:hypothetical protein
MCDGVLWVFYSYLFRVWQFWFRARVQNIFTCLYSRMIFLSWLWAEMGAEIDFYLRLLAGFRHRRLALQWLVGKGRERIGEYPIVGHAWYRTRPSLSVGSSRRRRAGQLRLQSRNVRLQERNKTFELHFFTLKSCWNFREKNSPTHKLIFTANFWLCTIFLSNSVLSQF